MLFTELAEIFANHLMIPSVVSALHVSAAKQNRMQIAAVAFAASLYLILGSCRYFTEEVDLPTAKSISKYVSVLSLYASIIVRLCPLTEIVIAWRYGANITVAEVNYPNRVKAVRIAIPFVIYLPIEIAAFFGLVDIKVFTNLPHAYMLCASIGLIVIAYCCDNSDRRIPVNLKMEKKWVILLYIGGLASLATTLAYFWCFKGIEALKSSLFDFGILVLILLWSLIGRFVG
jgi:hypothetical protein